MAKTSIGQAKKMGLKMLYLGVFSTNKVAHYVHEKVGFKEHIRLKEGDKLYAIKKGKLKHVTIVEESVIMKLDLQ